MWITILDISHFALSSLVKDQPGNNNERDNEDGIESHLIFFKKNKEKRRRKKKKEKKKGGNICVHIL